MTFICGVLISLFSFCSLFNNSSVLIENLKIDPAKNAWVSDENDPNLFRQIALIKDSSIPNLLESGKLGETPLSDTQKDICTEMAVAISVIRESIHDVLNCPLIGSRAKELIANLWFNINANST